MLPNTGFPRTKYAWGDEGNLYLRGTGCYGEFRSPVTSEIGDGRMKGGQTFVIVPARVILCSGAEDSKQVADGPTAAAPAAAAASAAASATAAATPPAAGWC